jgi:hypothetical protein
MNALAQQILENVSNLPPDMQQEALAFVQLLKRQITQADKVQANSPRNGKAVAEIMARIAKRGTAFRQIDPVAWQNEVRKDRPLPGRLRRDTTCWTGKEKA